MAETESAKKFKNEQLQKATDQIWDLIKSLVRQLNVLAAQNLELKNQTINPGFVESGDWIDITSYQQLLEKHELLIKSSQEQKSEINNLLLLKSDFEELQIKFNDTEQENLLLKSSLKELDYCKKTLLEKNLIISEQNDEINELKSEIVNNKKYLDDIRENYEDNEKLQAEIEGLVNQLAKFTEEISQKNWVISELEQSITAKNVQIEEMISKNKNLLESIPQLESQLLQKEKDFTVLRSEKMKIESELTKSKISIRELTTKNNDLQKSRNAISLFDTHSDELTYLRNELEQTQNKVKELNEINHKYRNEILKTKSGMLPISFGNEDSESSKVSELNEILKKELKYKENLEKSIINLENLLILKIEEIQKIEKEVDKNKEEYKINSQAIKSRILDLKKQLVEKGII